MKKLTSGIGLVVMLMCLLVPAITQAATTVGASPPPASPFPPPNDQAPCSTGGIASGFDLMQDTTAAGAPSYVVPSGGGVITSWRTTASAGTGTVKLRVFSPDSTGGVITPVGESDPVTVTPASTPPFPTRISVSGGEKLGLTVTNSSQDFTGCANSSADNANEAQLALSGPLNSQEPSLQAPPGSSKTAVLLNVSASVEPDADGDGYGDETQDHCLGKEGTLDGCPTLELGKSKANAKKGTATITAKAALPGVVKLAGKNVVPQKKKVGAPGKVKLTVKPKGRVANKLNKGGKAKVKVTVTFTATDASPVEETATVKLKKG
jgi:hypothetical protein